jgi:ribosomal subunit interface protein
MQLTIQGKQIELGKAIKEHIAEKIEDLHQKFFNHTTFATVMISREGHGHGLIRAYITMRIGKDILVMGEAEEGDPYLAFDVAAAKVTKQLRRYKSRLRDHHERIEQLPAEDILHVRDAVIGDEHFDGNGVPQGKDPVIVAEMTATILTLSVSDAVMRMDLAGQTALLFRNASNGELNMVYRRKDGNVGWVDPSIGAAKAKPTLIGKAAPHKASAGKRATKTAAKAKSSARTGRKPVAKKKAARG